MQTKGWFVGWLPHCYLGALLFCLVPVTEVCSLSPESHFQIHSVVPGDTLHSWKISTQSENGRIASESSSTKNHPFFTLPGSILHLLKESYTLPELSLVLPHCSIFSIEFYCYLCRALPCYSEIQDLTLLVLFLFACLFSCFCLFGLVLPLWFVLF